MNIPRSEYPRPQFVRENWLNLNGEWDFSFHKDTYDQKIVVPYVYQTKLSGIHNLEDYDKIWYRKEFELPESMCGKKVLLHFGAVDYECELWVNEIHIGNHAGGHISFEFDISHAIKEGKNRIVLSVMDSVDDMEIPRGKQYWKEQSEGIFYTRTMGIWQTVWLEAVNDTYLKNVFITPDVDRMMVSFNYEIAGCDIAELTTNIYMKGNLLVSSTNQTKRNSSIIELHIDQQTLKEWNFMESLVWTPENPVLFDVEFLVKKDGILLDKVESYFGMRKVSIEDGIFKLNNRIYYQKLLLDQGYWEDSLLTAPDDSDFVKDIELAKAMGFNGVRKHQKIEDPRFLYHADRMGFLVWGEIAAAYVYTKKYVKRITDEWMDEIIRDYNHPSIVVWTPLNESWGVFQIKDNKEQQSHSAAMVYLTKSFDTTRPVISNDGWEHTCTDILSIHDYEADKVILKERYRTMDNIMSYMPGGRKLFANGWNYQGQPIMVTEFGGISYKTGTQEGWGYSSASSEEDFVNRYYNVVSPLLESPHIQGFCYTEITDVEQEINGLYTYDRKPKADPEIIRAINEGRWKPKDK